MRRDEENGFKSEIASAVGEGGGQPRSGRSGERSRRLDPASRDRLGKDLQAMYQSVVRQPVPDRFAQLIARLDPDED